VRSGATRWLRRLKLEYLQPVVHSISLVVDDLRKQCRIDATADPNNADPYLLPVRAGGGCAERFSAVLIRQDDQARRTR